MKKLINEIKHLICILLLFPVIALVPKTDEGKELIKSIKSYASNSKP